jgi:hypothetical protein
MRFDKRNYIASGNAKAEALAIEEARLIEQVSRILAGERTNAEQREMKLTQLKAQDPAYRAALNAVAQVEFDLAQYEIDIKHYSHKLQAGLQAVKYNTALLRFLAED